MSLKLIVDRLRVEPGTVQTTSVVVDAEMAFQMLTDYAYGNQRRILPSNWRRHYKAMTTGKWLPDSQIDLAVLPDGTTYLINGYHRLTAQVEAATEICYSIRVHGVRDAKEAEAVYSTLDTDLMVRGVGTVVRAAQETLPGDFQGTLRAKFYTAIMYLMFGRRGTIPLDEMEPIWREYLPAMNVIGDLLRSHASTRKKVSARLKANGFLMVMLETFRLTEGEERKRTYEFWNRIVEGNDPTGHTVALRDFIIDRAYKWVYNNKGAARPRGGMNEVEFCASAAIRIYQRYMKGGKPLTIIHPGKASYGRIDVAYSPSHRR